MNANNSTRMKMTPKYGGPGEAVRFRIPFAATKAALTAFLRSRGDMQGAFKRGRLLQKPTTDHGTTGPQTAASVTPQKTDYRQTLKALMRRRADHGLRTTDHGTNPPPFFRPMGERPTLRKWRKPE